MAIDTSRCATSFLIAIVACSGTAIGQTRGTFVRTGDMTTARSEHTATLLADGRVLLAGGYGDAPQILSSAELYDPASRAFVRTGDMAAVRRLQSATLLPDGRVLIAGGFGPAPLSSAELYDPATGIFTPTGAMVDAQGGQTATLLANGTVLIAGGALPSTAARPELYDPATGTFSLAGKYADTQGAWGGPMVPTANLLPDGRILFVALGSIPEIYDPVSGTFSVTGRMIQNPFGVELQAAASLRDGTVLITGGNDDGTCGGFNSAEIFDPSSGTFRVVGPMLKHRDFHTATLLRDGSVLVAGGGGGWCGIPTHDSAELYIPSTRTFIDAGTMSRRRSLHSATLLNDGSVLLAGGFSFWPPSTARSSELYVPATEPPSGRRRGRQ